MARLTSCLIIVCCLVLPITAKAAAVNFKFSGKVTQTTFDPEDPFGGAIASGSLISGQYYFDPDATDSILDPSVGSYTSVGIPYGMTVNIGGVTFSTGDFLNIGVVDGVIDQYTVLTREGAAGGLGDSLTLSLILEDVNGGAFSKDLLPVSALDLTNFGSRTFRLDAIHTFDGTLFQYELQGSVSALFVSEPGSAMLVLLTVGVMTRNWSSRKSVQDRRLRRLIALGKGVSYE